MWLHPDLQCVIFRHLKHSLVPKQLYYYKVEVSLGWGYISICWGTLGQQQSVFRNAVWFSFILPLAIFGLRNALCSRQSNANEQSWGRKQWKSLKTVCTSWDVQSRMPSPRHLREVPLWELSKHFVETSLLELLVAVSLNWMLSESRVWGKEGINNLQRLAEEFSYLPLIYLLALFLHWSLTM